MTFRRLSCAVTLLGITGFIGCGSGGDDSAAPGGDDGGSGDAAAKVDGTVSGDGSAKGAYAVKGSVTGLLGSGLVLKNSGGDDLHITKDGAFSFASSLPAGASYAVTVATQPSAPAQTCTVANGSGTIGASDVTNIAVTCKTSAFSVGGTVTGLVGSGLVLQDNSGDDLTIGADGAFKFATKVDSGKTYTVSIAKQPSSPDQTCTIAGGSGTIAGGDVSTVAINCSTKSYMVGGTVTGLVGTGLVLQDNGGDNLSVNANGSFSFAKPISSGAPYAVTILSSPTSPTQVCTVANGVGSVASGDVTNVAITCKTSTFTVGGTVTGLSGSGLVLQDDQGDNLAVTADGKFTFATPVASGGAYSVTVSSQPTSPSQTCTVTGGAGTVGAANVSNIAVTCSTVAFKVGGSVSGLAGSGLVLQDNGGDDLAVAADGTFAFNTPVASGAAFAVTIKAQPTGPSQTCKVSGGTGTVGGADVASIVINCSVNTYTVGGTITGLAGTGLVLQDNGGNDLSISASGTFAFSAPLNSGTGYAVTVLSQPSAPSQTCTVNAGTGTVTSGDVTSVSIDCTTNDYTVGVKVVGLAGSGLVLNDNGTFDSLPIAANGNYVFAKAIPSGTTYAVTVASQPASPTQSCVVTSGSATMGGANVTDVTVTCTTTKYTVGGAISGLAGTVVLQDNAGDDLTVNANGTFTFATPVESGAPYAVTVLTQPGVPVQTCTVTAGSGTVVSSNVTSVSIACVTSSFTVGGTASGVVGSGLVLSINGGGNLPISGNGPFTFASSIQSGATYTVTIASQPTSPSQTCTLSGATGTVTNGNVTSVALNCSTNTYTIGGAVTGLAGGGLVLQDNGGNNLTVTAAGTFAFSAPVSSGNPYAVTVLTQPTSPWQTCTVTNGTGTVGAANVTNVAVACTTNKYSISLTASGVAGSGLVVQDNNGDNLAVTGNGQKTFATTLASGATFNVTVLTQPSSPTQTCVVAGGNGVVAGANVTAITLTCTTSTFSIGGTVSGMTGSGLVLQDNNGDDLAVSSTPFTFATKIASGATYAVTVKTSASGQLCTVSNGAGTVGAANVTNVAVTCGPIPLPASCRIVAGVTWCYDPATCGEACGTVCSVLGMPFTISDATWFAAQDTAPECQAINDAFGLGGTVSMASFTYACAEDSYGTHSSNGPMVGPLLCSTYSSCPSQHRTNMDQLGVACGSASRRALCPCQ